MHTSGQLAALKEAIASRSAVLVVGTGVSLAVVRDGGPEAAYAGWLGLLESGLAECLKHGLLTQRMHDAYLAAMREDRDVQSFLQAATAVETALGKRPDLLTAWLNATVGVLPCKNPETIDALGALGCPILTTNYDTLIANRLRRNGVAWTNVDQLLPVARGEAPHILHLHGLYTEPKSVVLGWASYPRVAEDKASTLLKASLGAMKTFVFVGCGVDGLTDPDLGPFFERYGEMFATGRHFRLCLESEAAATPHGITPITYPRHEDLLPLLKSLAAEPAPAAAAAAAPPTPALIVPPPGFTPLPKPLCDKVRGRATEVAEITNWLVEGRHFAVTGLAGMGKSTLCLEALRSDAVEERFANRRWFVRLDSAADGDAILHKLGEAMEMPAEPGRPQMVLAALRQHGGAVVLDNFETPWHANQEDSERALAEIMAASGVAVAVGIRGEARPTLLAEVKSLTKLDDEAARLVFVDIAGQKFAADPQLPDLLTRLDGHPLALHLLARQAQTAPSARWLLERLEKEWKRMFRAGNGRDRDLAASINLSVPDNGPVREILALLGLLPDGIGEDDAEKLVPQEGAAAAQTAVGLGLAYWENGRLRTLAPIREHLKHEVKPKPKTLGRCLKHHHDLLELTARADDRSYPALTSQAQNLASVIYLGLNHASTSLEFVASAARYSEFNRLTGCGNAEPLLRHALRVLPTHGQDRLKAICVWELGEQFLDRWEFATAEGYFEKARLFARQGKDCENEAHGVLGSAGIALRKCNWDEADQKYTAIFDRYQRNDNKAQTLVRRAWIDIYLARVNTARERLTAALALYASDGHIGGQGDCNQLRGILALYSGDITAGRAAIDASLRLLAECGNISSQATSMLALALAAYEEKDLELAQQKVAAAKALATRGRNPFELANCFHQGALMALAIGDCASAAAHLSQARKSLPMGDAPLPFMESLFIEGEIALAERDWSTAESLYRHSLDMFPLVQSNWIAGHCLRGLGDMALAQGKIPEAREHWNAAIGHYSRYPNPHWIAQIQMRLAGIATDPDERRSLIEAARATWTERKLDYWLAELGKRFPDA